jgi:hypothetical protein
MHVGSVIFAFAVAGAGLAFVLRSGVGPVAALAVYAGTFAGMLLVARLLRSIAARRGRSDSGA